MSTIKTRDNTHSQESWLATTRPTQPVPRFLTIEFNETWCNIDTHTRPTKIYSNPPNPWANTKAVDSKPDGTLFMCRIDEIYMKKEEGIFAGFRQSTISENTGGRERAQAGTHLLSSCQANKWSLSNQVFNFCLCALHQLARSFQHTLP